MGKLKSRYTADELKQVFKDYVDSHEDSMKNETYETPKATAELYIDGLIEFMEARHKAKQPLWAYEVDYDRDTLYLYKGKKCVEMFGASEVCQKAAELVCTFNNSKADEVHKH